MAEKPVEKSVEETKSEKRTVPELKEADQDACLKPFTIMTINMNGKASGKGAAKDQRTLTLKFIREPSPSVIFCQELPGIQRFFTKEVVEKIDTGSYICHCTETEAAVMWRKSDFHGDPVSGTDSLITKIVEKLQRERSDIDVSVVSRRTAMVKLICRGTSDTIGEPFLAVSWHGPWNNLTLPNRIKIFNGLILFVRKVCEKEKLSSFIIGGDFNLNTLEDIRLNLERHGVTVGRYDLCSRDENKLSEKKKRGGSFTPYKDNFVFTEDIKVSEVKALGDSEDPASDVVKEEHTDQTNKKKERENILDHAPVVGVLKLTLLPYKEPTKPVIGK